MTIIGKAMEEQRRIARFRLGSVVRRRDGEERGVIVWARGHGDFRAQPMIDGYPFAIASFGELVTEVGAYIHELGERDTS